MFANLKYLWRMARFALVAAGVALSFFALLEVLRAYQTLSAVHVWLGRAFLLLLLGVVAGSVAYFLLLLRSKPRILSPPRIKNRDDAGERELRKYCRYLVRYLERLQENPMLARDERARAYREREDLLRTLAAAPSHNALAVAIRRAEREAMDPLIAILDQHAERELRASVRDVMLGVTLLPYRSADLFIVVFRNAGMIARLTRIYHGRPLLGDLLLIFWDTLKVVATVNFLNLSGKLLESFGSSVPFFGRMADAAAQGLGAGYFTSIAGHGAMGRCRAYAGWDAETARATTRRNLARFMKEVSQIFTTDVLHSLSGSQLTDWSVEKLGAFRNIVIQVCDQLVGSGGPLSVEDAAAPAQLPDRRATRHPGRARRAARWLGARFRR
ncbi:DUF697 domain-containing protein [bacterium]|nr:DUF697 domain-containing protein [bacterium]